MTCYLVRKRSLSYKSIPFTELWIMDSASVCAQCPNRIREKVAAPPRNVLTTAILSITLLLMTIKQAIQQELNRRGWSQYRLVKELDGKLAARTVYGYLSGERDLTTERASIILDALGLTIVTERKRKRGRSPRRED